LPLFKMIKFILTSPRLRKVRRRAIGVSVGIVGAAVILISVVPAPLRSTTEGVIWIPDEAIVRARIDGYVVRLLAIPGDTVSPGDPLLELADELLSTELEVSEAALAEAKARFDEAFARNPVAAQIAREAVKEREKQLTIVREKFEDRILRAKTEGVFIVPEAQDVIGRFLKQGTVLAYVLNRDKLTARVVVPQDNVDLVRGSTREVQVRLAEEISRTVVATVLREVPAGSSELPSAALGTAGGGAFATDPYDQRGTRTIERVFQFDLELPANSDVVNVGGRVYARFDHGWEPLAKRWYRSLRRLFMSRFDV
jgi:putative peptide zinc metalloprotease protein